MSRVCIMTRIISLKPRSSTVFPRVWKQAQKQRRTRPGSCCQCMLGPAGTQFCLVPALPGLCSSLPITLGWRQHACLPGRLCVGPFGRLELPTTYFSGQEEAFGVRGLSYRAGTVKIKTPDSWALRPGYQLPPRASADRLSESGQGAGVGVPSLFPDRYASYLQGSQSCRN